MKNNNMFKKFLVNTKELNNKFNIIPVLFGSLGLQQCLKEDLNCDDIDILIPQKYLNECWDKFRNSLEILGYTLIDLHEHTFLKEGVAYSYASIEGLYDFVGIQLEELSLINTDSFSYLTLNLQQYLQVYKKSCLDGYRINKKEKKDYKKIDLIEQKIRKQQF